MGPVKGKCALDRHLLWTELGKGQLKLAVKQIKANFLRDYQTVKEILPVLGLLLPFGIFLLFYSLLRFELTNALMWSGSFLEISGLVVTFVGLQQARKEFKSLSYREEIKERLNNFRKGITNPRVTHVTAAVSGLLPVITATAQGMLTVKPPKGASLEEHIAYLEDAVEAINKRHAQTSGELKEGLKKLSKQIVEEKNEREKADSLIEEQLKEEAVGGTFTETIGLLWVATGLVLSSLANANL